MCPGSPLCKATVVIGLSNATLLLTPQGFPVFIFFFFYLLRCCSSSQNKSFIAISSWPCTRTPRALIELSASSTINNPKSRSSMSLSFFVFGFFCDTPLRFLLNLRNRSGSRPKDAVTGAAAWRGIRGRMPACEDCVRVCSSFLLHQCHPFVLEWPTSEGISKCRQELGGS